MGVHASMPPGVEDGPAVGKYVAPQDVARVQVPGGEVLVLLGSVSSDLASSPVRSPIQSHQDMDYLVVTLEPGARWRHVPPFAFEGSPLVQGELTGRELLAFEQEPGDIELAAGAEGARVLVGTARQHGHPLDNSRRWHPARVELGCAAAI